MIKLTKTYKVGENEIKCDIAYGFDKDYLINFPVEENYMLYMFIPRDEYDEEFFTKNENKNLNISIFMIDRIIDDEEQLSKLENVIKKMYEMQNEAYHTDTNN